MWYYADLYLEDVLLYRVIKLINSLLLLEQSTTDQVPMKRCLYGLVKLDQRHSYNGYKLLLKACNPLGITFDGNGTKSRISIEFRLWIAIRTRSWSKFDGCPSKHPFAPSGKIQTAMGFADCHTLLEGEANTNMMNDWEETPIYFFKRIHDSL